MPKTLTPVSEATTPVTAPVDDEVADGASIEASIQQLLNRTQYAIDNLGGGPALGANEFWARAASGPAEAKTVSDFALGVLALSAAVNHADAVHTKGSSIASAGTTNIAAATGMFVHITGTTTITAFGTAAAGVHRVLRFADALTLTHNASTLILPTGANITTAADDVAVFVSEGSGNWRCILYQRASGSPLGSGDASSLLGVDLAAGVGTPSTGTVIYYDGADYAATGGVVANGVLKDDEGIQWGLILNENVDPDAAIDVSKLAPGSIGDVLVVVDDEGSPTASWNGIVDANVQAGAAIAGTKIDPDFGSQTIRTTGDLVIGGNVIAVDTETVLVKDNFLYLNSGYETAAAQTAGFVFNYEPIATTDTVDTGGFTAGQAAVSNPTVATVGAATYSVGQLIQISGANDPANNGLFEVLSHAANVLTIRGVGTTGTVEDFTQTDFVDDTTVAGTITRLNVAVIRTNSTNIQEARGSTTPLTFRNLQGLDTSYQYDPTVSVIAAAGTILLENTTDATDVLTLNRTFAGAGDALVISMGASTTGRLIYASNNTAAMIDVGADGTINIDGNSGGAVQVTAEGTGTLSLGTLGSGNVSLIANGTGDAIVNAVAGDVRIQEGGTTRILVDSAGAIDLTAASGQELNLNAAGAGGTIAIDAAADEIQLSHAGGITRVQGDLLIDDSDVTFGVSVTAPTISQAAAADALGETLSVLGQDNNSATLKAGDAVFAAGTNAGAGADGDTIIGNGTTGIEIADNGDIGFFGATPASKPTVSGARNTQAALTDLVDELATLGLCTDSTTEQTSPGTDTSTSNAIDFDFSVNRTREHTLTENTTATFTAPPNIGDTLTIIVIQDAGASGYTITWPSAAKWPGGTAPTLTNAASAKDVITGYWDGTDYHMAVHSADSK